VTLHSIALAYHSFKLEFDTPEDGMKLWKRMFHYLRNQDQVDRVVSNFHPLKCLIFTHNLVAEHRDF